MAHDITSRDVAVMFLLRSALFVATEMNADDAIGCVRLRLTRHCRTPSECDWNSSVTSSTRRRPTRASPTSRRRTSPACASTSTPLTQGWRPSTTGYLARTARSPGSPHTAGRRADENGTMAAFFFSGRDYSSPKRDELDEFNLVRRSSGVKERRKQFWSVYIGVAIADT